MLVAQSPLTELEPDGDIAELPRLIGRAYLDLRRLRFDVRGSRAN
jgi:hypothetical protein